MYKYFLSISLFFCGILFVGFGQSSNLQEYIEELKKSSELEHAAWSVKVQNCKTAATVAAFNSQMSLTPASVNKLITTGVALELLGKDFRFKTNLMYNGNITEAGVLKGDLIIVGGGDPLLGSYRYKQTQPDSVFENWKDALLKTGIKSIDGDIVYDAGIFDTELIPGCWTWEDIGNYYGCGSSGLSFHENMYQIYFESGALLKDPVRVVNISPPFRNLIFENKVTTAAAGTGDQVIIYGAPYNAARLLTGTVPLSSKNFCVRGSLPDPAYACTDMFRMYLLKQKIKVSGLVSNGLNDPASKKQNRKSIIEYNSYSLEDIIELTNKQSNNMYAECIFRYLGYTRYGIGTYENSIKVVYDYLKKKNIDTKGLSMKDGSGLTQRDVLTSDFLCTFLIHMSKTPSFQSFFNSVPGINRSKNLNKLIQPLSVQKNVRVKTGSIEGVRTYAGYITNSKNEQLCFSILMNNYNCSSSEMRDIMDRILVFIANEG